MADLNKKVFRGIRQVSLATFNTCTDKEGYLWLVKDGQKRSLYFGNQQYADVDPDSTSEAIQQKIEAALNNLITQDLLHSFDESGKLQNEITFEVVKDEKGNPILHLKGKDNADVATLDMSQFIVDGMVDDVIYDKDTHSLIISFNTAAGKQDITVDLSDLIDIYVSGDGIDVAEDGTISLKIADGSQSFITVDENGLKLSDVDGNHIELGKVIVDNKGDEVEATAKVTDVLSTIFNTIKEIQGDAITVEGDNKSITVISDAETETKKIVSLKVEESSKETVDNGHIEVIGQSDNGVYAQMYYMSNVESTTGEITDGAVSGESVSLYNATVSNNVRLNIKATEDVELDTVTFSGDFPKTTSNAIASINGGSSVTLSNVTFDSTVTGYNAIEIGLSATELPKYINIKDCNFDCTFSNNAILIFGTTDNAVINIENCHFGTLSNCLRLSNKSNAKNVVVNVTNCSVDQWDTNPIWEGFLICEDYTSKSVEKEQENNLFGDGKITVNFTNLTHKGSKIMDETSGRVTYVYNDYGQAVTDEKYLPIVTFK